MGIKMIITALLVFYFCLRVHECSATPKTTRAKAVQIDEGNVIDCVDIYNQPSLGHPLLKNHKIQLKPSSFPIEQEKNSLDTDLPSSVSGWSKSKQICPDGTVPIYRTTKEEKIRANIIKKQLFRNSNPSNSNGHEVFIKMNKTENVAYFGAVGSSSIFNLNLTYNRFSTENIWVQGGPGHSNAIMAGSIVSPLLNGDSRPRLFVYWTADGNRKTGCFNFVCKGFIQISQSVVPKAPFEPVSTIRGKIYDEKFLIYQDPVTKNWWCMVSEQNVVVGYWPKELVPLLVNGADEVAWGGVSSSYDGINPPMGSGLYPDGFYDTAAYFRDIRYIVDGLKQISPQNNDPKVVEVLLQAKGCFKLQNDKLTSSDIWGYRFTFGGPGGSTCTS